MKIKPLHSWNVTVSQAREIQQRLSQQIILSSPFPSLEAIKRVAGVDVSYSRNGHYVRAAVVVTEFPSLKIVEESSWAGSVSNLFPYIPGFLSFREIPFLLKAIKRLQQIPEVILVDGQGITHPQRMGIATHLGIILDLPTVGCAKSSLYGEYSEPPPGLRGSYTMICDPSGEFIGITLRSRPYVKPVFVSPGQRMDIETAGDIVMATITRYRLPEPLRRAHQLASKTR